MIRTKNIARIFSFQEGVEASFREGFESAHSGSYWLLSNVLMRIQYTIKNDDYEKHRTACYALIWLWTPLHSYRYPGWFPAQGWTRSHGSPSSDFSWSLTQSNHNPLVAGICRRTSSSWASTAVPVSAFLQLRDFLLQTSHYAPSAGYIHNVCNWIGASKSPIPSSFDISTL